MHKDAGGYEITNETIINNLSDDALEELMAICHTEPAVAEECLCCAAYLGLMERERQKDELARKS